MSKYQSTGAYVTRDQLMDKLLTVIYEEFYVRQRRTLRETASLLDIADHRLVRELERLQLDIRRGRLPTKRELLSRSNASRAAHRTLMELGFEIPDGYEIHHWDGNGDNNSPDNLLIVTPVQHRRFHYGQE